ncbi:elongation factor 1-delta-like isoform X5 [Hetaerina americana]|uniref:elongation factor 1-delta-like isoform X5 n=1 Tax=Hetaerina americana TaxID=62018 RepID=UPI003A7F172F
MTSPLAEETIWLNKNICEEAERLYYESQAKMDGVAVATAGASSDVLNRLQSLELENADLKKAVGDLRSHISSLELRLKNLEIKPAPAASKGTPAASPAAPQPAKPAKKQDDDDDDVDLFGSDSEEEDDAAKKIREQRLAEYAARKSKKPVLIAKSNIILDVKPWDDETDMAAMEKVVRAIEMDGLVWGASKLVPLAFGIKKLQISCVVEDDKVSVDLLQETIEEHEDYVQSVDIAAFNKV